SAVALAGGGPLPRPGEISLAHCGVLFLDELPEYDRRVLEVLREPLESGKIVISRAARQAEFPARFQLVAAMNPCSCGYFGDESGRCRCTADQVQRYRARLSGPLLDRIDMHVEVPRLAQRFLQTGDNSKSESSREVKQRVVIARRIQLERSGKENARLGVSDIREVCRLGEASADLLHGVAYKLGLSARAHHRILRVARTIADLSDSGCILQAHVSEAISYRLLDRSGV
ncbi:MAG: ATP-binding protein, partial [Gammaproteobacteria bacterium]|nr:ATP-binding protein [Gammaproteobacteria bacterium]